MGVVLAVMHPVTGSILGEFSIGFCALGHVCAIAWDLRQVSSQTVCGGTEASAMGQFWYRCRVGGQGYGGLGWRASTASTVPVAHRTGYPTEYRTEHRWRPEFHEWVGPQWAKVPVLVPTERRPLFLESFFVHGDKRCRVFWGHPCRAWTCEHTVCTMFR